MVVDRTSPTYPPLSSSWTNSTAGAWRACNPTTVRTPCSAASPAMAPPPPRCRPRGPPQRTTLPPGGARLGRVAHLPVQSTELMQGPGRRDAQGGVPSARLHRVEPGCCDEPLDRAGTLVVVGRVEEHRAGGPVGLRGQ